jgi:hypothetical protein
VALSGGRISLLASERKGHLSVGEQEHSLVGKTVHLPTWESLALAGGR